VGVTFQDLKPQPIPLHPGSPRSLFNSVFYFHATLNRTEDWTWPSDATPKSMDHWLVADAKTTLGKPQLWIPEEKIADGWYNLRVGVAVISQCQGLLVLRICPRNHDVTVTVCQYIMFALLQCTQCHDCVVCLTPCWPGGAGY
jgi:hypothetical protein